MATENLTTPADMEAELSHLPKIRIEAVLEAGYELEALAVNFPLFQCDEKLEVSDEYHQKLFVRRIKELARVVMDGLSDERETYELRRTVGLED